MDFRVHNISLLAPGIPPQPDVLLAGDGAVGPWSTGGAAPPTAEGVDEVVQADEPCGWETQRLGTETCLFLSEGCFSRSYLVGSCQGRQRPAEEAEASAARTRSHRSPWLRHNR